MQVPYEYIKKQIVGSGTTNHVFNFALNYDCTGQTLSVDVFQKGINKIKTVASGISGEKRYKPVVVTGNFSGINAGSDYVIKVISSTTDANGNVTGKKTVTKGNLIIK